ncbi:hypothetical protein Lepto7375DRAFT_3071 [Leptolyngbya sp. PCC 7375]|nr:hypothetical protein Lepto7375DRAFT_3071 [Leptolyngbya sp. PCC 7375]
MVIELNIYLKNEDWIATMGGWRCDALLIPGAEFKALYYDGTRTDTKNVEIERHIIRWASGIPRPKELLVTVSLAKDLPQLEKEKLRLEREKLNLEHKKTFLENRWKTIAATGAIVSSLLTFGATYLVNQPKSVNSVKRPDIHTHTKELRVSEDQCLESMSRAFANYGLKNINLVQGGVYGEQDNYNVFVSCNSSLDVVFLVVSGAEASKARRIREDLKSALP